MKRFGVAVFKKYSGDRNQLSSRRITISECNEESFCQDGAIGGFSPPSRSLDVFVGMCLLLRIQKRALNP